MKNKKQSLIIGTLIVITIIAGVSAYLYSQGKFGSSSDQPIVEGTKKVTSYPVSYMPNPTKVSISKLFVNEDLMSKEVTTNYDLNQTGTCGEIQIPKDFKINSVDYSPLETEGNTNYGMANKIVKNPTSFLGRNSIFDQEYYIYKTLFETGNVSLDKLNMDSLNLLFNFGCNGTGGIEIYQYKQIQYPKTLKAYYVMYYGFPDSVADQDNLNLYFYILYKTSDSFGRIYTYRNQLKDVLTDKTALQDCEQGSGTNVFIDISKEPGKSCVKSVVKSNLDQKKVDAIINNTINFYKFK